MQVSSARKDTEGYGPKPFQMNIIDKYFVQLGGGVVGDELYERSKQNHQPRFFSLLDTM